MSERAEVTVTDDPDNHRYVATVDGEQAGFAVYRIAEGRYIFEHTEVDDSFGGQGVGGQLVRGALDDVRRKAGKVVALCPFVKKWIGDHEDYQSLIDEDAEAALRP